MTSQARLLAALPTRSVEELLSLPGAAEGRLQWTLHLASGQSLSGEVLRCDPAGRLVLSSGEERPRISFVARESVTAVTVGCSWEDLHLLGAPPSPPDDSYVPTRLQLRRSLEKLQSDLARAGVSLGVEVSDELLSGPEQARWVLKALLESLGGILVAIASEETGREALRACSGVQLSRGGAARVSRAGQRLTIEVLERDGLLEPFPAARLREELERVL